MLCTLGAQRPGRARSSALSLRRRQGVRGRHGEHRPAARRRSSPRRRRRPTSTRYRRAGRRAPAGTSSPATQASIARAHATPSASATSATSRRQQYAHASGHRRADAATARISRYFFGVEYAPQGPAPRAGRGLRGQDRHAGRPAAALLLPLRPGDRPLRRRDPERRARWRRAHGRSALVGFIVPRCCRRERDGRAAAAAPGARRSAMDRDFPLFPEQASTVAARGRRALLLPARRHASFFAVADLRSLIVYFAIRYRRRADDERPAAIHGSLRARARLDVIPLGIAMVMFVWGAERLLRRCTRAARRRDRGLRRRQAVDVEAPAPDRPARDQRAARAGRAGRSS